MLQEMKKGKEKRNKLEQKETQLFINRKKVKSYLYIGTLY